MHIQSNLVLQLTFDNPNLSSHSHASGVQMVKIVPLIIMINDFPVVLTITIELMRNTPLH